MGLFNTPDPPPQPNPFAVASAQTAGDVQTAIANAILGNPDQFNPFGSNTSNILGEITIRDAQGNPIAVPKFSTTTALSPDEGYILNQQTRMRSGMNNLALQQIPQLLELLGNPVNYNSLTPFQTGVTQPGFRQPTSAPDLMTSFDKGPGVKYSFDVGPKLKTSFDPGWGITKTFGQNRGDIVNSYEQSGPLTTTIGDAGAVQRSVGADDFSEDRRRVEEAIFSRLNPEFERQREALENKLVNQGLVRGTEAFNEQMDEHYRALNDARMQTILAGGQEQSRLFGMDVTKGQFANSAQQQVFNQLMQRGQFENAAKIAQEQQNAARAAFVNAAQQQGFSQEQAIATFENSAQNQQFLQNQALAQFFNQAAGQQFAQNQSAAQFYNQAQAQNFGQNQALAQFYNQAAQQGFVNEQGLIDIANSLAQQGFGNQIAAGNFNNQAAQAELARLLALRNQPINEITALASGGQVNVPQFAQFNAPQIPGSIIGQSIFNSANAANQQWMAQNQMNAQNLAGLFGLGAAGLGTIGKLAGSGALAGLPPFSDRRLKRDASVIGEHGGLPLWQFRYIWDADTDPLRVGMMADEVEKVAPEAVVDIAGYKAVRYEMVI